MFFVEQHNTRVRFRIFFFVLAIKSTSKIVPLRARPGRHAVDDAGDDLRNGAGDLHEIK